MDDNRHQNRRGEADLKATPPPLPSTIQECREQAADLWATLQLSAKYVAEWPAGVQRDNILKALEGSLADYRLFELRVAPMLAQAQEGSVQSPLDLYEGVQQTFADLAERVYAVRLQVEQAPWAMASPEHLAESEEAARALREARAAAAAAAGQTHRVGPLRGPQSRPAGPKPDEYKGYC